MGFFGVEIEFGVILMVDNSTKLQKLILKAVIFFSSF